MFATIAPFSFTAWRKRLGWVRSHLIPWSAVFASVLVLTGYVTGATIGGITGGPASALAVASPTTKATASEIGPHPTTQGFAEIVKAVRPAIVNITVTKIRTHSPELERSPNFPPFEFGPNWSDRDPFDMPPRGPLPPRSTGMGSGVLVSSEGYVVTNHHVVDGAAEVTVTLLDKRVFTGQVIGTDPQTDLAVVKIEGSNLPAIPWGDSDTLEVGDYVLAIGNPFGLHATVTQGIVSALGRGGMGITEYEDFIQTDAAINPGNSGGALVNMRGELVGINTAILSRTGGYQGIGFAIPASLGKPVYDSLVATGRVVRGYLGVSIQAVTPDLARAFHVDRPAGALVTEVKPSSPAAEAGLSPGDIITRYDGRSITDPRDLQRAVTQTPVGTSVVLTVVRDGQSRELTAVIGEHPSTQRLAQAQDADEHARLAGVHVEPLTPRRARYYGIEKGTEGVVVTAVKPGSPADQAGLAPGDVIREVNRIPIHSLEDYRRALSTPPPNHAILLLIQRRGTALFLSVNV
ncbi:MAG: DegQ family serine endoprotease [Nitrospirae bacterium]|nr:MAG: DegQ family serine endoprotease [Nitrospirota bacterium]